MRALGLVVALVVVLAACSSTSNPAQQVDTDAGDGGAGSSTTLDASETPDTTPDSTTIPADDQGGLVLLTKSGQGPRPLFSWKQAPEAARYVVSVMSESGETYWAGFTTETQLQMGDPSLPDDTMGPKIADGYSWVVRALDDGGKLVAWSETRAISP